MSLSVSIWNRGRVARLGGIQRITKSWRLRNSVQPEANLRKTGVGCLAAFAMLAVLAPSLAADEGGAGGTQLHRAGHVEDLPHGRRPNVLFLMTDQQRFDTIASLGNPHIFTPNLDRLAAETVTFRGRSYKIAYKYQGSRMVEASFDNRRVKFRP